MFSAVIFFASMSFAQQERLKVVFFTSSDCKWCKTMEDEFLPEFMKKFPADFKDKIDVFVLTSIFKDVRDPDTGETGKAFDDNDPTVKIFSQMADYYRKQGFLGADVKIGFPCVIAGNQVLSGSTYFEKGNDTIYKAIDKALANKEKTYIDPILFAARQRTKAVFFTSSDCPWCKGMEEDFMPDFIKNFALDYKDKLDVFILTSEFKDYVNEKGQKEIDSKTGKYEKMPDEGDVTCKILKRTGAYYKYDWGFPEFAVGGSYMDEYWNYNKQTKVATPRTDEWKAAIKAAVDNNEQTYLDPLIFTGTYQTPPAAPKAPPKTPVMKKVSPKDLPPSVKIQADTLKKITTGKVCTPEGCK